ncbi:MAG: fluoride efflux transporter CrcB [Succinivibrio sp.]|nr:fluoride efflux transporter CrcB [Succinivibrio sp.]
MWSLGALSCVFLGGGLGAVGRFVLSNLVNARMAFSFPLGTLTVNVLGSLIIGAVMWLIVHARPGFTSDELRLCVVVGFLGGFTTFSSFSLETFNLLLAHTYAQALLNVLLNLTLCLVATALGAYLASKLL